MLLNSILISLGHILAILSDKHTTEFVFILRFNICEPNLILILISVNLFELLSTIAPCNFLGLAFLHFNSFFASKEILTIIFLIINLFANAKHILCLLDTVHLFFRAAA